MFAWGAASGQPRVEIDGIGPEIDKGCKRAGRPANARLLTFLCDREEGGPRVETGIDDGDGSGGRGTSCASNASGDSGDSDGAVPAVAVGEGEGEGEGGQWAGEGGGGGEEKKRQQGCRGGSGSVRRTDLWRASV